MRALLLELLIQNNQGSSLSPCVLHEHRGNGLQGPGKGGQMRTSYSTTLFGDIDWDAQKEGV